MHTFWDYGGKSDTTKIALIPVSCDAPTDPAWTDYRRFPDFVVLQSGDSIAIGDTVPAQLTEQVGRETRITVPPEGLFAGVTRFSVGVGDGRIHNIRFEYGADADYDQLIADLTERFGPPTSTAVAPGMGRIKSWSGRTSSIFTIQDLMSERPSTFSVTLNSREYQIRQSEGGPK